MKISFPASGPTTFITVPDPEFRDQGLLKIGTTFKRMIDGTIVPFQHLPSQEEISLIFNRLKYKKAREFVDFLLAGNNQTMIFESDTGTSGEFLDRGAIKGTVLTDPLALVTQNDKYKNIAIVVALQETIQLQPKHIGATQGNQSKDGSCTSFYLISGNDGSNLMSQNDEYARFRDLDGVWTNRRIMLAPDRESSVGFTLSDFIFIATGHNGSSVMGQTNRYEPSFDADGVWFSVTEETAVARQYGIGFSLLGDGYVVGGEDEDNLLISCVEKFVLANESWSLLDPQICLGIKDAFSFMLTDKSYVGGGNVGSISNELRSFDGVVWVTEKADALIKLESSRAGADIVENKAVIFGGENDSPTVVTDTVIYDPVLNTLTASGNVLPTEVTNHTSASLGDAIYSVSGNDLGGTRLSENNEYTFILDIWTARLPALANDRNNSISPCSNLGGAPTPPEVFIIIDEPLPAHVVVTGGNDGSGTPRNTTYKWDFGTVSANVLWDMPSNRTLHHQASIISSIFVIDGDESEGFGTTRETFWEFEINDTWISRSLKGDFYDAQPRDATSRKIRFYGTCDSFSKSLYLMGGLETYPASKENYLASIDRWDSQQGWKANLLSFSRTNLRRKKYAHASAMLTHEVNVLTVDENGDDVINTVTSAVLFYIGGMKAEFTTSNVYYSNDVSGYVLSENAMVSKTNLPFQVSRLGCLNINSTLYAFTGSDEGSFNKFTLKYDSLLDVWDAVTVAVGQALDVADYAHANTSNIDIGANFGGIDVGGTRTNTIQTFDSSTDTWAVDGGVFPTATNQMQASAVNNTLTPSATKVMLVTHGELSISLRAKTFIFNPVDISISQRDSYGKTVKFGVMESIGGLSYLIGKSSGFLAGGNDQSTIAFDEATTSWSHNTFDNIPFDGIREGGASGVDGAFIVIGGGVKVDNALGGPSDPTKYNRHLRRFDTGGGGFQVGLDVGPDMASHRALGTVIAKDYYQFGGSQALTNFLGTIYAQNSFHFKIDFTLWGGSSVRTSLATHGYWRAGGSYHDDGFGNNLIVGGEDEYTFRTTQDVLSYDRGTEVITTGAKHVSIRNTTSQLIAGKVFIASGEFKARDDTPSGLQDPDSAWERDIVMYGYDTASGNVLLGTFATIKVIEINDELADGFGRSSSSF